MHIHLVQTKKLKLKEVLVEYKKVGFVIRIVSTQFGLKVVMDANQKKRRRKQMPKHASTQTDTRLCKDCTHYDDCPIIGTPCEGCLLRRDKPAWELMAHTPKYKVGDKVRMVSDALGKFLPIGAEGTVHHVRKSYGKLYPYIVDYASPGRWGAREEWLECIEPTTVEPTPEFEAGDKVRRVCTNLGTACPFSKEESIAKKKKEPLYRGSK